MKILINLSTLKRGGGQNVGLNFLSSLDAIEFKDFSFCFFVAKDSQCHQYLAKKKDVKYKILPNNPLARIFFEFFLTRRFFLEEKIDVIYTYFGIGVFPKKIPQVSGSADSNLYFPEINFWSHYSGLNRLKKRIIDAYRIWGLKRADAVIFENISMEERSRKLFNLKNTKFIMPSINFEKKNDESELSFNNKPKGLFLCSWQLNKNITIIPEIAFHLKKEGISFEFIITAPLDGSAEFIEFKEKVKFYSVESYINLIGTVKKNDLSCLYENIDFVFLLSKLESFSNNIIEAWYYKKLLIISDEVWARSICCEGALYINRDDAKLIANTIKKHLRDLKLRKIIIENANIEILKYPTINERTLQELTYLKKIYENN